jgi:hypothetical protein
LFKYGHCEKKSCGEEEEARQVKKFSVGLKEGKEAGSNVKPKPLFPVSIFDISTPPQAPALLLTVKCLL